MATKAATNSQSAIFSVGRKSARPGRWFLPMGIFMLVLGVVALTTAVTTTLVSVLFIGSVLLVSAVFQGVFGASSGRWEGLALHLLLGVLYAVAGVYLLMNPALGAATLTLFLALFFIISGLFRSLASVIMRYAGWGWAFFSGFVTTLLGAFVFLNLPEAALVFLGILVAVDLLAVGVNLTAFGLALK